MCPARSPSRSARALACVALALGGAACWHSAPGPGGETPAPAPSLVRRGPIADAGCVAALVDPGARPSRRASCQPGEKIEIRFAAPVDWSATQRSWVTVVAASSPPSEYGEWAWVEDGARDATLAAPTQPGEYEVRLHTEYPSLEFNVAGVARLEVRRALASAGPTPPSQQRFSLAAATLAPGGTIAMRFPAPMHADPGEQFWVTVVADGTPDADWDAWEYVADGAHEAHLPVPAQPGTYEVRLHARYPAQATNVVHRAALVVR